jgi:hypothetical protein
MSVGTSDARRELDLALNVPFEVNRLDPGKKCERCNLKENFDVNVRPSAAERAWRSRFETAGVE